jgi:hypothetical protein
MRCLSRGEEVRGIRLALTYYNLQGMWVIGTVEG